MDIKKKASKCLVMFEIIYSKRKDLGIDLIRLWSLKKMKDRVLKYMPLIDMDDSKYLTKGVIRDIDYIYQVFSTILDNQVK